MIVLALFLFARPADAQTVSRSKEAKKVLIVFFSHSGNTRRMAEYIQKATGGDLFEVRPVQAYPDEYRAVVDQAKKEVSQGFHPALKDRPEHIDRYDTVFVGSPNWWGTIAPPVATLLSSYDFSGKVLVPFITHEGSRFGHSLDTIRGLCPDARLLPGLAVRGGAVKDSAAEVEKWARETVSGK